MRQSDRAAHRPSRQWRASARLPRFCRRGRAAVSAGASIGWIAAGLVFAAFCMREMVSLRAIAIASNLAFIGYGFLGHLWPIVILHIAMLPMNTIRLRQALAAIGGRAIRHDAVRAAGFD